MMNRRKTEPVGLFVESVDQSSREHQADATDSYVFLHGLGGTHRYWTAAHGGQALPRRSSLVDLLGFGKSPRPFTRYTSESHLLALEPTLGQRAPFVLVGHSLGAALALAYAAQHPEDVKALVLIGLPAYRGRRRAVRWLRQRLTGWFLTNMVVTAIVCVLTRRLLGPILPYVIRDVPREVARDLVEHNLMSSTTSLWNVLYRRDVRPDADSLPENLPVVLIHGTRDTTAPIDEVRQLADERPAWQLVELEGVDHHPWLRRPETCAELIVGAAVTAD